MRTSTYLLAGMLAIVLAWAVACDDDPESHEPAEPADAAREDPGASTAEPEAPIDATTLASPSSPTAGTGEPAAATSPAAAATPASATVTPAPLATAVPPTLTAQGASAIGIDLERFGCDSYSFVVQSQPAALYKVHWTARAPADPGPTGSSSVSDAEVSQSPGEHSFSHAEEDWTEPGSNRLHITAWDVDGRKQELTQDIDC